MNTKTKIILLGSILFLLILFLIIEFFVPKIEIKLIGNNNQIVIAGEVYKEYGVQAYFQKNFLKEKMNYEIIGTVNTKKIGNYTISYKVQYKNMTKKVIRNVYVIDNIKPEIVLDDDIKVCEKNKMLEFNVKAFDNYDGDISNNVKYTIKENKIFIAVSDSSNNKTEIIKNIIFIDNEKPVISLNGSSTIYIYQNDKYEELGATAYDSCDGNITDKIEILGDVKTSKPGEYNIQYLVKDTYGNQVKATRKIVVKDKEQIKYPIINDATIYLTFDDGPSQYTEGILKILEEYDIKATFFVTNQFPDYQHLIKKTYENGHSIGIHTYSHKWSIYKSVSAYLEDFNKINSIIVEQTGMHTKLFRFPGGSSNTVSRNYSKGIMSELSRIMTEKGYIYFDWTFDSGDTNKKNNSASAIIKNFKANLKGNGEYVVLLHDIKKSTLEALPEIIELAKEQGYSFASLNESSPTEHFKIAN